MGKEITVRQNRCDREMNFLLFGVFFLFLVVQMTTGQAGQGELARKLGGLFYIVFVPGFFFREGYRFFADARQEGAEEAGRRAYKNAVRLFAYYLLFAMGQIFLESGFSGGYSITAALTLQQIPSVSAVFLSLALVLVAAGIFSEQLGQAIEHRKTACFVGGLICLFCAMLRVGGETYPLFAAVLGADGQAAVPAVPYFAFFLLGMWFGDCRPGFQWKYLAEAALISAAALLLCRLPVVKPLGLVLISFLPIYLVYIAAEGMSELTLRFRVAGFFWASMEPVILASSAAVFAVAVARELKLLDGIGSRLLIAGCASIPLALYLLIGLTVLSGRLCERGMVWFETRVKHKTATYFLLYTLAFLPIMALVFSTFLLLGRSFVWIGDGLTQYFPRAIYFSEYMRGLLSNLLQGNFTLPMYDFRNGMGSEIIYSFEPLYFLHALFDEAHMEFAYNLVTILRFYLAGISSSILFLYFKKNYFSAFLGSVIYISCGFALYGGAKHTMFMIAMVMLPLLILAIEEIIRGRRWYLCTIMTAISLFSNYYFLYMNTIAMGIYFLVRFFCQKEKERRTFGKFLAKGLTISGSYLLGVAMSCIVLVTTFGSYIGSTRNGAAVIATPSLFFYSGQWLVSCFLNFIMTFSSLGYSLRLGYLPIALLAVVFLYTQKGKKEQKLLFAIAALFMLLPVAAFVFSGFSSIINRWCYIISLLVAFIVADSLPDMLQMKKRSLMVCAGAVLLYGFLALNGNTELTGSTPFAIVAFVELAATFAVLIVCQDKSPKLGRGMKRGMLLVLTSGMLFSQGFTEFTLGREIGRYMERDKTEEEITDTPLAALSEVEDDSFYRVTAPRLDYLSSSASLLLDFYPITTVSSVLNGNEIEYMGKMGSTSYSTVQLRGLGNRTMLHSLAAVKYYAEFADEPRPFPYGSEELLRTEVNGRETVVCENKYALPIGYTYKETISEEELERYQAEERQEILLQKVMLADEDSAGASELQLTGEYQTPRVVKEKNLHMEDHALVPDAGKKKHRITLAFEGKPRSETYLVLRDVELETDDPEGSTSLDVIVGDDSVSTTFWSEGGRYKTGQRDYVINLGYHEEALTSCELRLGGTDKLSFGDLAIYCQPMDNMEQYTKALTEDVLEHVEIGTNRVSGDIELDEDKILVLSIPYQNGWTATVDSSPVKLERANYMYMALPLEAGAHTVELSFEIPGVKYALVIMPCAVVLFIILCFVTWLIKRRNRRKSAGEEV